MEATNIEINEKEKEIDELKTKVVCSLLHRQCLSPHIIRHFSRHRSKNACRKIKIYSRRCAHRWAKRFYPLCIVNSLHAISSLGRQNQASRTGNVTFTTITFPDSASRRYPSSTGSHSTEDSFVDSSASTTSDRHESADKGQSAVRPLA